MKTFEIERKYLVDIRKLDITECTNEERIKQYYIENNTLGELRIRKSNNTYTLCVKSDISLVTREEHEVSIPNDMAISIIAICSENPHIIKKRLNCMNDGHQWQIDFFEGNNEGLILAEIELSSEEESYSLPEWITDEVTYDTSYRNCNLANNNRGKALDISV